MAACWGAGLAMPVPEQAAEAQGQVEVPEEVLVVDLAVDLAVDLVEVVVEQLV